VEEDPAEVYIRARNDLLKSAVDFHDYEDNIANYAFAKLSLEHHGIEFEPLWEDRLCESILKSAFRTKLDAEPALSENALLDLQVNNPELAREYAEALGELKDARNAMSGSVSVDEMLSFGKLSDRVAALEAQVTGRSTEQQKEEGALGGNISDEAARIPQHTFSDRIVEHSLRDIHRMWPQVKPIGRYDESFLSDGHGLLSYDPTDPTGRPMWARLLRGFYLPQPYQKGDKNLRMSLAERYASAELAHLKANKGKRAFEPRKRSGAEDEEHIPHFGPLMSTSHAVYEQAYQAWRQSRGGKLSELMVFADTENPVERDYRMREEHFKAVEDHAWFSTGIGGNVDPKSTMSQEEIAERGINDPESLEEYDIDHGFGIWPYLLGLDFLPPADMHRVLKHIDEHGTDKADQQIVKLSGPVPFIDMGRVKRDFAQRFTPLFHAAARNAHHPGATMRKRNEGSRLTDARGFEGLERDNLFYALSHTPHPSNPDRTLRDFVNERFSRYMNPGDTEDDVVDENYPIPNITAALAKNMEGNTPEENRELLGRLKPAYAHSEHSVNWFLGRDKDGALINDHPLYPDATDANHPAGQEDLIERLHDASDELTDAVMSSKFSRDIDAFYHLGNNVPSLDDIPESERESWLRADDGSLLGLAHYWGKPFHYEGGYGKHPKMLIEMLHQMWPGERSPFGQLEGGRITPNEDALGLTSRYISMGFAPETQHAGSPRVQLSFFNASQPRSETAKRRSRTRNQAAFHGKVSTSPAYSNSVAGKSDDEIRQVTGGKVQKFSLDNTGWTTGDSYGAIGSKQRFTMRERASRWWHWLATRMRTGSGEIPDKFHSQQEMEAGNVERTRGTKREFDRLQGWADKDKTSSKKFAEMLDEAGHDEAVDEITLNHLSDTQLALEEALQEEFSSSFKDEIGNASSEEVQALIAGVEDPNKRADMMRRFREIYDSSGIVDAHREFDEMMESYERVGESEFDPSKDDFSRRAHVNKKFDMDMAAVTSRARQMFQSALKTHPEHFNPNNPQFIPNVVQLFHAAEKDLLMNGGEQHGLKTWGYAVGEKPGASLEEEIGGDLSSSPAKVLAHGLNLVNEDMRINMNSSNARILDVLRIPEDQRDQAHIEMAERIKEQLEGHTENAVIMTVGEALRQGISPKVQTSRGVQTIPAPYDMETPDAEGPVDHWAASKAHYRGLIPLKKEVGETAYKRARRQADAWAKGAARNIPRYFTEHRQLGLFGDDRKQEAEQHGLMMVPLERQFQGTDRTGIALAQHEIENAMHAVLMFSPGHPGFDPAVMQGAKKATMGNVKHAEWQEVPVGPVHPDSQGVINTHYTGGLMDRGVVIAPPSIGFSVGKGREPTVGTNIVGDVRRVLPSKEQMAMVTGAEMTETALNNGFPYVQQQAQHFSVDPFTGTAPVDGGYDLIHTSDPVETLMVLLDPQALLKSDESRPPPVLAMHRIFALRDLDSLRGFSDDWAVSGLPRGERLIVKRESDDVTAYDEGGEDVKLKPADVKQFKALADSDYVIDVVRAKKEFVVYDLLSYDDNNVSDMLLRERIKLLRAQFDSHEHVIVPGPHNFRMTDREGLEAVVEALSPDHDYLMLRDATSTYMKGERRHPKWFMLRKDKVLSFMVLDARGKGPFVYRLGAGPVDAEDSGNRVVEHEGKHYVDVGTVRSPKPFNEGDVIQVRVSGVRVKRDNKTYDVTVSNVKGTSEDESPASLETLSLLTKSHPIIAVPFDVTMGSERLTLDISEVDSITYRLEKSQHGVWAIEGRAALGAVQKSDYAMRLAESLRPLWMEAAALISKGTEKVRSMTEPKNQRQSAKESAGIIEEDDEEAILKPKKVEVMAKTLMRIADLMDRIEKERMTGGPGARGFSFDAGSQVESPRGPTRLTSEESLPDWDMKERPTEDPEEEYPEARRKRLKDKNERQSTDLEENVDSY